MLKSRPYLDLLIKPKNRWILPDVFFFNPTNFLHESCIKLNVESDEPNPKRSIGGLILPNFQELRMVQLQDKRLIKTLSKQLFNCKTNP